MLKLPVWALLALFLIVPHGEAQQLGVDLRKTGTIQTAAPERDGPSPIEEAVASDQMEPELKVSGKGYYSSPNGGLQQFQITDSTSLDSEPRKPAQPERQSSLLLHPQEQRTGPQTASESTSSHRR